jgi:uncharacterized protein involved in outer membrane biogenesis
MFKRALNVWVFAGLLIALLFAGYVVAGYTLVPGLIRSQAIRWADEKLDKRLALGEVRFDPFRLAVDINDIALPAEAPMVSVGALRVDVSFLSLFTGTPRFNQIAVSRPKVAAVLKPDGSLNLAELSPPPSDDPTPRLVITDLLVSGGEVSFADHRQAGKPDKVLRPLGFRLKDFRTFPGEDGRFELHARTLQEEDLTWRGTASLAPVASRGEILVNRLHLVSLTRFLGEDLPLTLSDGQADVSVGYNLSLTDGGAALKGTLRSLSLRDFAALTKGDLPAAQVNVKQVDLAPAAFSVTAPARGPLEVSTRLPSADVRGLALRAPKATEGASLAHVQVSDLEVSLAGQRIGIGAIRLEGLSAAIERTAAGTLRVAGIAPPAAAPRKPASASPQSPPWKVSLGRVEVAAADLRFTDQAVTPASRFRLSPLNVALTGDLAAPGGALGVDASTRINDRASLSARGTVNPQSPSARLDVNLADLPLEWIKPYLAIPSGVDLRAGVASARGDVAFDGRNSRAPDFSWKGAAAVEGLEVYETQAQSRLLAWKRFALEGMDLTPKGLRIASGRLTGLDARLEVLPDTSLNIRALLTEDPEALAQAEALKGPDLSTLKGKARRVEKKRLADARRAALDARAAQRTEFRQNRSAPDFPVTLERLTFEAGRLQFSDYAITPNFAATIDALRGRVDGVTNRPGRAATVQLDGQVISPNSPVVIRGTLDPLDVTDQTDLTLIFRNIELPVFNPYSGRYAGYAIARGKLTTELHYRIVQDQLNADHHVVIDQLEWGEATGSKDKVPVPIRLATSLLKDKNGVIDLNVPVTGSLEDPKFQIWPIVWQVVRNLFSKAASSPFQALASSFPGVEGARYVDFAPGSSTLTPGQAEALAALVPAFADRLALNLDIPAGPGLDADAKALADARMADQMMARDRKRKPNAQFADLDANARLDRLRDLYRETFGKSPEFPASDAAADAQRLERIDWMTDQLQPRFAPDAGALAALGQARAKAISEAIVAAGVDPSRVFVNTNLQPSQDGDRVRLELALK